MIKKIKSSIYTLDLDNYLLKKIINYYSNLVFDKNYLLFDSIINNELKFSIFNLLNNSFDNNNKIFESLNFKINYNIPKIMLWKNTNKFLFVYENNQLCNVNYSFKNENNNEINHNNINIINDNNNININININEIRRIPNIDSASPTLWGYEPEKLFVKNYYYCSKYPNNQFIVFDYKKEIFFKGFTLLFHSEYKSCRPKNYKITILNNEKSIINIFAFTILDRNCKNKEHKLNNRGRYIRFDFIDNFGGNWIIIKNLQIDIDFIYSVQ